jgi:hypothetical protein
MISVGDMDGEKSKNNKPILSILIDEDKRSRFSDLARQNNLSMGWLVNQAIDKMLESGSINIYTPSATLTEDTTTSAGYIDEIAKKAVEKHLASVSDIKVMLTSSIGNVNTEIEALEKRLGWSEKLAANQAEEIEQIKNAISDRASEISSGSIGNPINELPLVDNGDEDTLEPQKIEDSSVDLSKLQGAHTLTWVAFLSAIGMEIERDKDRKLVQNVRLAKIAIGKAIELGSSGWEYISLNRQFIRT